MNKILIVIESGIVSSVIADHSDVNYVVIDYDPKGDEPLIISNICTPEKVPTGKLSDYFTREDYPDSQIRDTLRKLAY